MGKLLRRLGSAAFIFGVCGAIKVEGGNDLALFASIGLFLYVVGEFRSFSKKRLKSLDLMNDLHIL